MCEKRRSPKIQKKQKAQTSADESEEFSACSVDNEAVDGLRYEVDMVDDAQATSDPHKNTLSGQHTQADI